MTQTPETNAAPQPISSTDLESFRLALEGSARAISGNPDLAVELYSEKHITVSDQTVMVPKPRRRNWQESLQKARGEVDKLALKHRLHDAKIHAQSSPADVRSRAIYESMERTRQQIIGAKTFPGIQKNLLHNITLDITEKGYDTVTDKNGFQYPSAISLLLWENAGLSLPENAQALKDLWFEQLQQKIPQQLAQLQNDINDQEAFHQHSVEIMQALGFQFDYEDDNQLPPPENSEDEYELDEQEVDIGEMDSPKSIDEILGEIDHEGNPTLGEQDIDPDAEPGEGEFPSEDSEEANPFDIPEQPDFSDISPSGDYRFYCDEFDEVIPADQLVDADDLHRHRIQLDQHSATMKSVIGKLANRLQRHLLAQQQRTWSFDLEEGVLDSARLSRVITNPTVPLSFKQEKQTEFKDTVVTLLLDNSGSMRGRPIIMTAVSADVLTRVLEQCGVKTEILGFTTKAWKGGQSRLKWLDDGKPEKPGRLNDLRHIIYKPADLPWRRAKFNLGVMFSDGVLKENVDGEALMWAYQRLSQRKEQRKIIIVISDGAPVDDATLSVNSTNYLDAHLRDVIDHLEKKDDIELLAIGIGHDVTRYYKNAITLRDAEALGSVLADELAALFTTKKKSTKIVPQSLQNQLKRTK
jgi:cobaltochelatase CobT